MKQSLLVAFIAVSCASPSVSTPRNGVAISQPASAAVPSIAATAKVAAPEQVERVDLADVIAAPERYLSRLITVRGRASVCPDLCDGIKIRCGLISPAKGPCYGYSALASDESSKVEARCAGSDPHNAILVDIEGARPVCRGHCGSWVCPKVELGRSYEVTARLSKSPADEGATRYALVPEELKALDAEDVESAQGN